MKKVLFVLFIFSQTSLAGLSPFVTIEGKVLKKTSESLYLEIEKKKVRIPLRYLDEKEDFDLGDEVAIELERAEYDDVLEQNNQKK